jgi:hypothetical protein
MPLTSDAEVLKFGSDHAQLEGLFIELGVCTGKTINFIAALNPQQLLLLKFLEITSIQAPFWFSMSCIIIRVMKITNSRLFKSFCVNML